MATKPSSTVGKAFRVLRLFRHQPVLTATMCAEKLGIPRPTAHRLLISLREAGVVETTAHGNYRLSLLLFELGSSAPLRRRLSEQARTKLEQLADDVGFRVNLGVRQDGDVLYLETVHGRHGGPIAARTGHRGPIHATGLGKLLLAHAPGDVMERAASRRLRRFTHRTLHTPERLREEIMRIRRHGVAFNEEELLPGLACVAAPIRGGGGAVMAAISISTTPAAMRRKAAHLQARLLRTGRAIEAGLVWEHTALEPCDRALWDIAELQQNEKSA